MSKLNNLKAKTFLTPFKATMGAHFEKVCLDIDSWIGALEKDIVTKSSGWQVGTKNRLVSKDGNTLQLPPNATWTILVRFGMQLTALNEAGSEYDDKGVVKQDMNVQSDLPYNVRIWFTEKYINGVSKSAKTPTQVETVVS